MTVSRFGSLVAGAVVLSALSGVAHAATPPGVSIDGGATLNGWDFGGLYPTSVVTFTPTQTNLQSSSSSDIGLLPAYISGLTIGQTYTVSFGAWGTGFLDVLSNTNDADGDAFLNVSGNETDASFNASIYRSALNLPSEVFRISNPVAQMYNLSFVANNANATLYFKSEKLEGGLTVGVLSAVPEPETYAMMLAGLGALGFMARRRTSR